MSAKRERKQQRRARKRKAQRARQPSGQQILLKRAQQSDYLKDAQIVVNPGDMEKMPDVILQFAEPLIQGPAGVISKNAIRLAIAVWNASLLPKAEQLETLKALVDMLPEDDQDARRELAAAFDMLLARKRRYFAKNTRVILDYQITESADMVHLDVISTPGKAYHLPQLEGIRHGFSHPSTTATPWTQRTVAGENRPGTGAIPDQSPAITDV